MFTDDQIQTMRDFLARKLAKSNHPQGVHVHRREVEGWGEDKSMTPEDADLLLAGSKGVLWEGEYIVGHDGRWSGAWVTEVR
jgi:hypothetical protein